MPREKREVLVAGGAGYIGSHAVRVLHAAGYLPVVLDNLSMGHRRAVAGFELIEGDILDTALLNRLFAARSFHAVMHYCAFAYVGESVQAPLKYYRNNVAGTINLLQAMEEHKVPHFIFSSSCAVYGEPEAVPIAESHPRAPINPYGRTKLIAEEMMADVGRAFGLKWAALRYFNAAGADPGGGLGEDHQPETHLIPLVLAAALGLLPQIEIFGADYPTPDGTCIRDYIHVTDLAEAHLAALKWLEQGGQAGIFNLGCGQGYSVKELIETARRVTGRPIPIKEGPRRAGDPARLVAAAQKAGAELGWRPRLSELETIIKTAWAWHKKHPRGYES